MYSSRKSTCDFIPTQSHLDSVRNILYQGSEDSQELFDQILAVPLRDYTTKYREFIRILKPFRQEQLRTYGKDPIKQFYRGNFTSKEEFLAYIGELSFFLYNFELGNLALRNHEFRKRNEPIVRGLSSNTYLNSFLTNGVAQVPTDESHPDMRYLDSGDAMLFISAYFGVPYSFFCMFSMEGHCF